MKNKLSKILLALVLAMMLALSSISMLGGCNGYGDEREPTLSFTTEANLPFAAYGTAYSTQISVSSNMEDAEIVMTNRHTANLPSGLSFNSETGVISGIVTQAPRDNPFTFTISANCLTHHISIEREFSIYVVRAAQPFPQGVTLEIDWFVLSSQAGALVEVIYEYEDDEYDEDPFPTMEFSLDGVNWRRHNNIAPGFFIHTNFEFGGEYTFYARLGETATLAASPYISIDWTATVTDNDVFEFNTDNQLVFTEFGAASSHTRHVTIPSTLGGTAVTALGIASRTAHPQKITVPASVTAVRIFGTAWAQVTLFFEGTVPPTISQGNWSATNRVVAIIVPNEALSAYRLAWTAAASFIFSDADIVNDTFLVDGTTLRAQFGLEEIVIVPENVTTIAARVFNMNHIMTSIVLPTGLTLVEGGGGLTPGVTAAFMNNTNLRAVFFGGTPEQFAAIDFVGRQPGAEFGPRTVTMYFYSATAAANGWRMVDGIPTPW